MSIKYINNNDKVIDNPYLAELDNVIHPVGIVMPWIKHIVPEEVCKGMIDMLDSTGWFIKNIDKSPQEYIDSHRVLDICCRSGNFLRAFYERFNVYLSYKIKNQDKRDYFIWRYLLFGFAGQIREELSKGLTADQENKVADAAIKELRKELYSGFCFYEEDFHGNIYDIQFRPYLGGNNLVWTGKDCPGYTTTFENRAFGKELNEMKFNAVIGNPPYNNDVYIDFVTKGHAIATDYSLWITPAKWQAKGGEKNEQFRKDIVPYMSKIVYYPCTEEIFDITEIMGITYYLLNSSSNNNGYTLKIKTKRDDVFHKEENINVHIGETRFTIFDSRLEHFCRNVGCGARLTNRMFNTNGEYRIRQCHQPHDKRNSLCCGGYVTTPTYIEKNDTRVDGNYYIVTSGNEDYCNYFNSYINTKFVRFCIALGLSGSVKTKETWRFVPDPGAFDHIFTDEELYKKYNLTDEEINIIESVIKERK